jgi:biotin-[acetyl-CoA-carboxylase] ligase BirA-like protein
MSESTLFKNILYFQALESTNDFLKANEKRLENHTIVLAGYQTKGKGQFERVWESLPNLNLLFSFLFKEEIDPFILNEIIVLSLLDTLQHYSIKAWYKDPNDIYVENHKISGVLMETKFQDNLQDYLIVGIGLNINQQYFNVDSATSMSLLTGIVYDIQEVFHVFLGMFEQRYHNRIQKDDE